MNKRLLLATAVSLACIASANAAEHKALLLLPPAEYDHPYTGRSLEIQRTTPAEIVIQCPATARSSVGALACAFPLTDSCTVVMVDDDLLRKAGFTPELVLRHELGHCNGWSGDHEGARPWQMPPAADWDWEKILGCKAPCILPRPDPRKAAAHAPMPKPDPRKAAARNTDDLGRLLFGRW
jgi:hypothetical protein